MKFEWGWRSVPLSFCFAYYSWTRVRGVIRITWALSAERQTITVPYVTKLHRIRNKESRVVKDLDSSTQPLEGLHCLLPEVPKGFYRGGCSIQLHLAWWMTRMSDSADGSRVMTTPYSFPPLFARYPHLHALKSDKSDATPKCLPFTKFIW